MYVKGICEEFKRVFLVVGMSPSCLLSIVACRCHVFRDIRSFYEGCDNMCVRDDDIRMYKY